MADLITISAPGPMGRNAKITLADGTDLSRYCQGADIHMSVDDVTTAKLNMVFINTELPAELAEIHAHIIYGRPNWREWWSQRPRLISRKWLASLPAIGGRDA